jgi:hypothetical protein
MKSLIIHLDRFKFRRIKQGALTEKQFELVVFNASKFGVRGIYADLPRDQFLTLWREEERENYAEAFDSMETIELTKM